MNRIIRAFFVLIGFCTAMQLRPLDLYGISFFTPRSQSTNLARHMAGKQAYINRHDTKNLYGLWQATVAYQVTFQDLGADSLDMVQLVMKMEEQFGIEINDEDAEKFTTLSDVIEYIHQRRSK